jgi:arginyl-tRNA synthetase
VASRTPIEPLVDALHDEARSIADGDAPAVVLEPPAQAEHGDLASPLAMALARLARRPPRELAERLAAALAAREDVGAFVARAEVAGPGFINLTLTPAWFAAAAREIAAAGDDYGAGQAEPRERILIEFVSANPTGPPHVGHARHAAYGDSLARILERAGHAVTREYYVNDYGRQMELFGASVAARYAELLGLDATVPEDGYQGDYVREIAEAVRAEVGDGLRERAVDPDAAALREFAVLAGRIMLDRIRADLDRFRVRFDAFFSETTLHEEGRVSGGVEALERAGDAYRSEGALWFRTSSYGDEKDRVLIRGDGATTYLASDVAYHLDKAGRGQDRLLDVLGADHHGYVGRLRAVLAAGGHDPEVLEVLILQLVSLVERGEARRMSKRAGTLVSLADLLDDIGVDAARFFLVERSHDTALDLDLDLARERSQENPVYYVQYAHARVAGVLRNAPAGARAPIPPPEEVGPLERALVLRLAAWPDALLEAEVRRAPHRVAAYLKDLARDFHAFYAHCRIVGEPPEVEGFRLDLCVATASVIRNGLGLLGVEAPERM